MLRKPTSMYRDRFNTVAIPSDGFTLIELLVYIALTSTLLVLVLSAAYPILRGTDTLSERAALHIESTFVRSKATWILSEAVSLTVPASGETATELTAVMTDGTVRSIRLNNDAIEFREGTTGTYTPFTPTRMRVEQFVVTHMEPTSTNRRAVEITLRANDTPLGSMIKYVAF